MSKSMLFNSKFVLFVDVWKVFICCIFEFVVNWVFMMLWLQNIQDICEIICIDKCQQSNYQFHKLAQKQVWKNQETYNFCFFLKFETALFFVKFSSLYLNVSIRNLFHKKFIKCCLYSIIFLKFKFVLNDLILKKDEHDQHTAQLHQKKISKIISNMHLWW